MARDTTKNLQLSANIEYDVYNWKLWEAQVQEDIEYVLNEYGREVIRQVNININPEFGDPTGPGPHPHVSDGKNPPHQFTWEDTGKLARSVDAALKGRGFLKTVEIFVEPVQTEDGRIVDYGTFLEVGWHPVVPTSTGMRVTGNFYAYPWLSKAVAEANMTVLNRIEARLKQGLPQFHIFAKPRLDGGNSVKVNPSKFAISENITSGVDTFMSRAGGNATIADRLTGWLKPWEKVTGVPRIPGIRSKKVQDRVAGKKP